MIIANIYVRACLVRAHIFFVIRAFVHWSTSFVDLLMLAIGIFDTSTSASTLKNKFHLVAELLWNCSLELVSNWNYHHEKLRNVPRIPLWLLCGMIELLTARIMPHTEYIVAPYWVVLKPTWPVVHIWPAHGIYLRQWHWRWFFRQPAFEAAGAFMSNWLYDLGSISSWFLSANSLKLDPEGGSTPVR